MQLLYRAHAFGIAKRKRRTAGGEEDSNPGVPLRETEGEVTAAKRADNSERGNLLYVRKKRPWSMEDLSVLFPLWILL